MMKKSIRLAGAQIPVHDKNLQENKIEILKALDWAKENEVDILQTPEAALSGYDCEYWEENIEETKEAEKEVIEHVKKVGVGLNLGTLNLDDENYGSVKRNQIRHFNKEGERYGITNKTYLVYADLNCVPNFHNIKELKMQLPFHTIRPLHAIGVICNDMWGASTVMGKSFQPIKAINEDIAEMHVDLIFHSTHGFKFPEEGNIECEFDFFKDNPGRYQVRDVMDKWNEAWLEMTAFRSVATILTVDACTFWGWDDSTPMDNIRTSSPSGIVNPLGKWETDVPRYGRQYFHYDYDVKTKEKYWEQLNEKTNGSWKTNDLVKIKTK